MEFSFFGYFRRWTHLVKGCLRCFGSEHTRLVSRPMKMAPLILFKFCRGEAHAGVHAEDWSAQITLIWMCKQTSNCRWRQVGQGCHRSLLWSGHLGTFDQVKLPAPQLILYVNLWREAGNTLEWLTCWCTLHREGCRWDSKPQPQNSDAVVLATCSIFCTLNLSHKFKCISSLIFPSKKVKHSLLLYNHTHTQRPEQISNQLLALILHSLTAPAPLLFESNMFSSEISKPFYPWSHSVAIRFQNVKYKSHDCLNITHRGHDYGSSTFPFESLFGTRYSEIWDEAVWMLIFEEYALKGQTSWPWESRCRIHSTVYIFVFVQVCSRNRMGFGVGCWQGLW